MQIKRSVMLIIAGGTFLAAAPSPGQAAQPADADRSTSPMNSMSQIHQKPAMQKLMQQRIESAESIINQSKSLEGKIQKFHQQAELQIAQAKTLRGEAHEMHSALPPIPGNIKMDAAQLRAAQDQYKQHISGFQQHAQAYQGHLKDFQRTLGECHANEDAFQRLAQAVTMHVDQFHMTMPAIRPPHVCGVMDMSRSEVSRAMNSMRADMQRVQQSEGTLAAEENRFQQVRSLSAPLDRKVVDSALRNQQEQELYAEFGKLHTEYELLRTEKNVLAAVKGTGAKVVSSTVAGEIKHR
jgi:hypothetical protein